MNAEMVMQELEVLGKERTKKIYKSNGAQEPLFGVATGEELRMSGAGVVTAGCSAIDQTMNFLKAKLPVCLSS